MPPVLGQRLDHHRVADGHDGVVLHCFLELTNADAQQLERDPQ